MDLIIKIPQVYNIYLMIVSGPIRKIALIPKILYSKFE